MLHCNNWSILIILIHCALYSIHISESLYDQLFKQHNFKQICYFEIIAKCIICPLELLLLLESLCVSLCGYIKHLPNKFWELWTFLSKKNVIHWCIFVKVLQNICSEFQIIFLSIFNSLKSSLYHSNWQSIVGINEKVSANIYLFLMLNIEIKYFEANNQ